MVLLSSPHARASISNQTPRSRRRRGQRPNRPTSPPNVPLLTKEQDSQPKTPSHVLNRELAFRQLTEQLWAAGLPSSKNACSMSVRSRCSSAPPSERGGGDDDNVSKIGWNNAYDDEEEEEMIDWDEPGKPEDGNSHRKKNKPIFLIFYYHTSTRTHVAYRNIDCACFCSLEHVNSHRSIYIQMPLGGGSSLIVFC